MCTGCGIGSGICSLPVEYLSECFRFQGRHEMLFVGVGDRCECIRGVVRPVFVSLFRIRSRLIKINGSYATIEKTRNLRSLLGFTEIDGHPGSWIEC